METSINEKSAQEVLHSGNKAYLDEWVGPDRVDNHGHLRPGKILEWMDVLGALVSTRYAKSSVVTASIDGLVLERPIKMGARITMSAVVCFTSEKTMGVKIKMDHIEDNQNQSHKNTHRGHMVFVAVDEQGRPKKVPPLMPSSKKDHAYYREGRMRYEFHKKFKVNSARFDDLFFKKKGGLREGLFDPRDTEQHQKSFSDLFFRRPLSKKSELTKKILNSEIFKRLPYSMKAPWGETVSQKNNGPRLRHISYIHKIEPVFSGKLNFTDTLYGGTLMSWVENAAHLSAKAYLKTTEIHLASLHGLNFLGPVKKNVFVHIRANVVHTNKNQLTVLTEVQAEEPIKNVVQKTLRAFFTYKTNDSTKVPKLVIQTQDDEILQREVMYRLEFFEHSLVQV